MKRLFAIMLLVCGLTYGQTPVINAPRIFQAPTGFTGNIVTLKVGNVTYFGVSSTKATFAVPILPSTAAGVDLGSTTLPFKDIYIAGTSGTPAANNFRITGASTDGMRTVYFPDADTQTVRANAGAAHEFFTGLATTGIFSRAQPAFTDISGIATTTQGGTGANLSAAGAGTYPKSNGATPAVYAASTLAASGVGTPTACTNQFVTGFTLAGDSAPTSTCTSIVAGDLGTTLTPQFARVGAGQAADATAPFAGTIDSATTNTILDVLKLTRSTTGTAGNGIGAGFALYAEDASGNIEEAGRFQASFPIAAHATQTGRVDITVMGLPGGSLSTAGSTAWGVNAGQYNIGADQTATGDSAGKSNSGDQQTATGVNAGVSNTGASQTVTGVSAGVYNSGDQQTATGVFAGKSNTGASQTATGVNAGLSNTEDEQTATGFNAGLSNSGVSQTATGVYAGQYNTGGYQTATGATAGDSNTGGYQTATGNAAGYSNTGVNQTAMGVNAGQYNSGVNQTATGVSAGQSNTGGYQTTMGVGAGYSNTGTYQTATGVNAGQYNTGASQTTMGYSAGYLNTGASQTGTGAYAGYNNIGDYQTATGYGAGQYNNWPNTTRIGYQSSVYFPDDAGSLKNITEASITAANTITYVAHGFGTPGGKVNVRYLLTGGTPPVGLVHNTIYQFTVTSADVLTLSGIAYPAAAFTGTLNNSTDTSNSIGIGVDANPTKANQAVLGPSSITETLLRGAVIGPTSTTAALYKTTTNCADGTATPADCAAAPAGAVIISAAATSVVVNTTAVTATSRIMVTRDNSLGTELSVTCNTQSDLVLGTARVTAKTAATSFTIAIDVAPTTDPACYTYLIFN
jgi:hypothetical protein